MSSRQEKPRSQPSPETKRMLEVLQTMMRVLGKRNRDLERKLGKSPGYLSRVFSGDIALRHDLIVDFARALELEPGEVFRAAYPPSGPPSQAADNIAHVTGFAADWTKARTVPPALRARPQEAKPKPQTMAPEILEATIRAMVHQAVRELVGQGEEPEAVEAEGG